MLRRNRSRSVELDNLKTSPPSYLSSREKTHHLCLVRSFTSPEDPTAKGIATKKTDF